MSPSIAASMTISLSKLADVGDTRYHHARLETVCSISPVKHAMHRSVEGLTLIELIVIIAIIALLVALLLPVSGGPRKPRVKVTVIEIAQIVSAIHEYESAYGHFPVSKAATGAASASAEDLTFGARLRTPTGTLNVVVPRLNFEANNSEIMAVLLDLTNYPETSAPTVNADHAMNPKRIRFLNASLTPNTTQHGVGADLVYRDIWGTPYIITIDCNNDRRARDAFYRRCHVSKRNDNLGFFGLFNYQDPKGNSDCFEANCRIMVWSAGPDRMVDPDAQADQGANRDNVLSWRE